MLTNARSTSGSASTSRARSLRKRSASSSAVSDTAFWPCRLVKRYVPRNGLTHASGQVFAIFEKYGYTVADLEATNLWERLEAEAQLKGKC